MTLSRVALGGRIPAVYDQRCIIVTTCEMVAVVHRRPRLQHLACCSVNSRHIGSESRFLPTPPAFDAPLGDSRWNIAISFGMEKLKWCGCPTVKTFRRYLYSSWHKSRTWQTHIQTLHDGIGRALCIASRGKNDKCNRTDAAALHYIHYLTRQQQKIMKHQLVFDVFGHWKKCVNHSNSSPRTPYWFKQ